MYKVTGIIPCHNHALWVCNAIASMVKQDLPPNEIIVIDNGSTDNSFEKIVKNADGSKMDSSKLQIQDVSFETISLFYGAVPVRVFSTTQALGPAKARNIAFKLGWNTDIFAMLDSDDIYMPGKISHSVNIFKKYSLKVIGAVYSDYTTKNYDTGVVIREHKRPFDALVLGQDCIVNNDSLISKVVLEEVGLYDETMRVCEDYDLWLRVAQKKMIFHIPYSLVELTVGQHSSTDTVPKEVWRQNWQRIREKYAK